MGATMAPPAATNQLRRARLGIRGYLVLYAAGLGSMLLGGSVVHAVAQPDLVCWVFRSVGAPRLSAASPLSPCAHFLLSLWGGCETQWRPLCCFCWGGWDLTVALVLRSFVLRVCLGPRPRVQRLPAVEAAAALPSGSDDTTRDGAEGARPTA